MTFESLLSTARRAFGLGPRVGIRSARRSYVLTIGMTGVADKHSRLHRSVALGTVCALVVGLLLPGVAYAGDRVDGRTPQQLKIPADALPDVGMKAGALVTEDGRVLWSRRAEDRRAMASITKVMTAVIALESGDVDDPVTVPADATSVGESTSFLRAGERLALGDLLEALLVKSGNDAAVAIAKHVSRDEDRFVDLMNEKAKALGMTRTHFTNAHGLDEKDHYSTATDLAVLARYAMRKPELREVVGEKTARLGAGKRVESLASTNLLLGNYDGANGIKTGWTNDAGYCVVGSARRDGVELYAVVLGTNSEMARFKDARELLDWGFAHYRLQRLSSAGTVMGESVVSDYLDMTVPAAASRDSTVAIFGLGGSIRRTVTLAKVKAPLKVGDKVGVATFTQAGKIVETVPLVATQEVPAPNPFERAGIALVRGWRRVFGGPMTATAVPAAALSY